MDSVNDRGMPRGDRLSCLCAGLADRYFGPQIGGILSQVGFGPKNTQVNTASPASQAHPEAKFNTMGDPNAPVRIIEYADFQCPYCLQYWRATEPQIIKTYVATGKVYYEYRSVGAFIGPDSALAAEAVYCAGDQNKFWNITMYCIPIGPVKTSATSPRLNCGSMPRLLA